MVCAFGPREHDCLIRAAELGGDLRVGFENSLTDASGRPWRDNADSVRALVARIETLAVENGGNHATLGAD